MAEDFKVIETQQQFDEAIKERIERERKKASEASAELQKKIQELESQNKGLAEQAEKYKGTDEQIAEMQAKIKKYETDSAKTRIAREVGLPYEMSDRIRGNTDEEMKADAEALLGFLPKRQPPQKSTETVITPKTALDKAYAEMAEKL